MSERWTPARISTMMRMWDRGDTASDIAAELGMTRSAVLGKIFRLGLSRHPNGRPRFDVPIKSFNCFLTHNQVEWLRKTFGHKRMSAGIRGMLDEAMQGQVSKAVAPKNVIPLPATPKPASSVPWPDKRRLMAGR